MQAADCGTLVDLLRFRAHRSPGESAYLFLPDGGTAEIGWTWEDLDRRAGGVAGRRGELDRAGRPFLRPSPPGLEFLAGFFGCLYAGAIAVPAAPPRPHGGAEFLAGIARDAGAVAL